jgi:hypothetical protein
VKTFVVLAVSIVMVSILLCPMAVAAPPMPNDVQMVEPDPSLPKELAGFLGKWEGSDPIQKFFLIIEKIDEENAGFYHWRSGTSEIPGGWRRFQAKVSKESGKYKLWYRLPPQYQSAVVEYTLKGKYLDVSSPTGGFRYTRVP